MAVNIVEQSDDAVNIERILVSVSDKAGLDTLIPGLVRINSQVTLYSTGGTYQAIEGILGKTKASQHLVRVSDYTGQPEMQGGLVKTLDFKIYLGLLSETYNHAHVNDLRRAKGVKIDMVVVNLYPFKKTVTAPGATPEQARANIDIGGPCMVRAAAKNFLRVASITDPLDYNRILSELEQSGGTLSLKTRFELAKKAFAHTAAYDTAIAGYLARCDVNAVRACYTIMDEKKDES